MSNQAEVTFSPEELELAINLVARESAKNTGRHIEWVKRRLREAVLFCDNKGPEHKDWNAYYGLARPVFLTAAEIGGLTGCKKVLVH